MPHRDFIHDGIAYPSVTEVLSWRPKPWLEAWRAKWGELAERKTACANAIGTAFHAGAEKLSLGEYVEMPENRRLSKMLEQIEAWMCIERFVPKETEMHVISHLYKYHGTIDAIGTVASYKQALVLIDYKTSSGIYPEMAEQLAAYAQAYWETRGLRIKVGIIVHVSKQKPAHVLTVKEYKLTKTVLNKFLRKLKNYWKDQEC